MCGEWACVKLLLTKDSRGTALTARVEEPARQIESLGESDLQAWLERVEELSFRHGIDALSNRYRRRLKDQAEPNEE